MKDQKIELTPIGVVKATLSDSEVRDKWNAGIEAEIEVFDEYAPALDGIDDFSHIIVLFYLHKTSDEQRKTLKARPRRFLSYGLKLDELPLVGVFCLDSPHRPNPLGLTIVRLLKREGNILRVSGLDAFDGTPVLDIKPYTTQRCVSQFRMPDWLQSLLRYVETRENGKESPS